MIEARYAPMDPTPSQTESAIVGFRQRLKSEFPQADAKRAETAFQLMQEVHEGQKDRTNGAPYAEHPLQVASFVLDAMEHKDPDVVIAALLHDTVEDQAAKLAAKNGTSSDTSDKEGAFAYIERTFGQRVRNIVSALTNPDFEAVLQASNLPVTRENKTALYVLHVVEAIQDPDVALIKYGDFSSNAAFHLDRIDDQARMIKLARKYLPVFPHFIERFQDGTSPINMRSDQKTEIISDLISKQHSLEEYLASHAQE